MLAISRDTFDDSRPFAPVGVFLKGLTFFNHAEY